MPSAAKALPLILLLAACGGKSMSPTRTVDASPFEKGTIKRVAFVGGDTLAPDVQNRIVDALCDRYTRVAKPGMVYRREAVLTQLGAVRLPPPSEKKYKKNADTFGNISPEFAMEMKTKVGVDAFYVIWVVDWSGSPVKTTGLANDTERVEIRREVVAQIFESGTGRELWHTRWVKPPEESWVRLVPQEEYDKAILTQINEAIEELWVSFWIG